MAPLMKAKTEENIPMLSGRLVITPIMTSRSFYVANTFYKKIEVEYLITTMNYNLALLPKMRRKVIVFKCTSYEFTV